MERNKKRVDFNVDLKSVDDSNQNVCAKPAFGARIG